jgi:hypothetical protein
MKAPLNKKELQSLIGKINFIRRFISNLSERIQPFTPLLKLNANQKFVWGEEQQKALDNVKQHLKSPPILTPLKTRSHSRYTYRLMSRLLDRPWCKSFKEKSELYIS